MAKAALFIEKKNENKYKLNIKGSIEHYYDIKTKELVLTFSGGGSKVPSDDNPPSTKVLTYLETDVNVGVTGSGINKKTVVEYKPESPTLTYLTKKDIRDRESTGEYEVRIKINGNIKEVTKQKKIIKKNKQKK